MLKIILNIKRPESCVHIKKYVNKNGGYNNPLSGEQ